MKRKNKQSKFILLVIAILSLLLMILFTILSKSNEVIISNKQLPIVDLSITDENITIQADLAELNKIKAMNERNRIEYYVSNYIRLIEEEKYEEAYSILNKEYKKNYFNTRNDFEKYCRDTFSNMLDVEYTNFERNGEIYVVWLTITDAINGNKNSGIEMNFVVKENDFNDYELSFSVI